MTKINHVLFSVLCSSDAYVGCFNDKGEEVRDDKSDALANRALNGNYKRLDPGMTIDKCMGYCQEKGELIGIESAKLVDCQLLSFICIVVL